MSGQSVGDAMRFLKLTPEDIIVFHDELDLAPGKCRLKKEGGHAGHNGLRSLHKHIGADYHRVRIGIGHPGHKDRVAGYVLHDFTKADHAWLNDLLSGIGEGAEKLARKDIAGFMNNVLPTGILGDLYRTLNIKVNNKNSSNFIKSLQSVIFERLSGQLALVVTFIFSLEIFFIINQKYMA